MKKENVCKLFLCYRNSGKSSDIAAAFKSYVEAISSKVFSNNNLKLECYFSGAESLGNYEQDIPKLLKECKIFIIFADEYITSGFVNLDGSLNKNCITAKEFCEAEKLRQEGKILLQLLNINGYKFTETDSKNIGLIFDKNGILKPSSVNAWLKLNENDYSSSMQEEVFNRLLKGILQANNQISELKLTEKNIDDHRTDLSIKIFENLNKYFKQQYSDNMYTKLDDIAVGDGENVNQLEIEKTFIDLNAYEVNSDNISRRAEEVIDVFDNDDFEIDYESRRYLRRRSDLNIHNIGGFAQKIVSLESEIKPFANALSKNKNDNNTYSNHSEIAEIKKRNLVLMGRAGQGKTTLMQFIALLNWEQWLNKEDSYINQKILRLAKKEISLENGFDPRITIKINLSIFDKYTSFIRNNSLDEELLGFEHYVAYLLSCAENSVKPYGTKNTKDEEILLSSWIYLIKEQKFIVEKIQDLLKSERILVLFDGLDEVKTNRQFVVSMIKNFVGRFSNNELSNVITVTTTRKEKSEELLDDELFSIYDLLDLDENKVKKCVNKYIRTKWIDKSEEKTNDIMRYYEQSEYKKLMLTPLEVTMICMVYNAYNSMPKSIEILYDRYVVMYIQRERQKQYPEGAISKESKEFFAKPFTENLINDFLNAIGYELEYNSSGITKDAAIDIARKVNIDADGDLRNEIDDENYFEKLIEIVFTRLSFFDCNNAVNPPVYSLDNHHASVREFLAARYFVVNRSDNEILYYVQWVLTEQDGSPQHWGIFRFILGLIINRADLVKNILRRISNNCSEIFNKEGCDDIIRILSSSCFGAKIAVKIICEERVFDGHVNYRKSLINAALNYLSLENIPDSQHEYGCKMLHYAHENNLTEDLFCALSAKLVQNNVTDELREMIALLSIFDDSDKIDKDRYPELYETINSDDMLNFIFKRYFSALDYSGTQIISGYVEWNRENDFLEKILKNAFDCGKSINISFSEKYPLVCKDKQFFSIVEFVRALFLNRDVFEPFYSEILSPLFFGNDYELLDDLKYELIANCNTIAFCTYKNNDEVLLRFFFDVYFAENDDGVMDKLLMHLKANNLDGIYNLFLCIKEMNKENFISFVKSVESGKWDGEFQAVFGNHPKLMTLRMHNNFCANPAFIMLNRHLSGADSIEFLNENTDMMFELIGGKTLNFEQAFSMYDRGMFCKVTMPNIENSLHIKLIDDISKHFDNQLPFIFSGLEWRNRFETFNLRNKKDKVSGVYSLAVADEEYQKRKCLLKKHLEAKRNIEYSVISILNFLLADAKCGNKELCEYENFVIKDYAKAIENMLVYTYSPHNLNIMTKYQYAPPHVVTDNLFHGEHCYKTLINNLIILSKDSEDYFEYFKKALIMLLNSEEFILSVDIRGLCLIYNGDLFLRLLIGLREWRKALDESSRLSNLRIVVEFFSALGQTDFFASPQVIYTMLLRFITNNFRPNSMTGELVSNLLDKIPTDGNYCSVRKEAQNYLALLPRNIEFSSKNNASI